MSIENFPFDVLPQDLQSLQQQETGGGQSDLREYLTLKNMLEEKKRKLIEDKKKTSRQKILNKMKQNRRMSLEPEDDSDQKIEALQLLVRSNINDALVKQKPGLMDITADHMSYVIPSAESLHMYNSQVEKPSMSVISGQALQNSLPFLVEDPSQYNSQSVMVNPPANIDLSSFQQVNTPSPASHSTLPFLKLQPQPVSSQVPSIPFSSFINPSQSLVQSRPSVNTNPFQPPASGQNFQTSFVTPNTRNRAYSLNTVDRKDSFLDSPQPPNSFYKPPVALGPAGPPLRQNTPQYVSPHFNQLDLDSHLRKAKEEQELLESQLKQLQQVEENLKKSQMSGYNTVPFTTSSSIKVPKSLGGFPMNFEDMLSTGLELAKQSKGNSLSNQHVGEVINPRNFVSKAQSSWKNNQNSKQLPVTRDQGPDGFNPSPLISKNIVQNRPHSVNSNTIDTDQIHVIGPNCYVMTANGFKSIGTAPSCIPANQSRGSEGGKTGRQSVRSGGRSGSIWDSISSIPLVNKLTRSFGIK